MFVCIAQCSFKGKHILYVKPTKQKVAFNGVWGWVSPWPWQGRETSASPRIIYWAGGRCEAMARGKTLMTCLILMAWTTQEGLHLPPPSMWQYAQRGQRVATWKTVCETIHIWCHIWWWNTGWTKKTVRGSTWQKDMIKDILCIPIPFIMKTASYQAL